MRCWFWWRKAGEKKEEGDTFFFINSSCIPFSLYSKYYSVITVSGVSSPLLLSLCNSCLRLLRTLYIEGERKLDFSGWCGAIQTAAGSGGDTLSQQQLTETDIPVIVHSCIGYITQCGECHVEENGG